MDHTTALLTSQSSTDDIESTTTSLSIPLLLAVIAYPFITKWIGRLVVPSSSTYGLMSDVVPNVMIRPLAGYKFPEYTNLSLKLNLYRKGDDQYGMILAMLYFTMTAYLITYWAMIRYLDDKKCKVDTFRTEMRQVIGGLIAGIIIAVFLWPQYGIMISITGFALIIGAVLFSMNPAKYNMMLQLNSLLVVIPVLVWLAWKLFNWYSNRRSNVSDGMRWLWMAGVMVAVIYITKIVFVGAFVKEVGYYCNELILPSETSITALLDGINILRV